MPDPAKAGSASSRTWYRYNAYGLALIADAEMPELPPLRDLRGASLGRVTLRIQSPGRPAELPRQWLSCVVYPDGTQWLRAGKLTGGYLLSFPGLADFRVDASGREVAWIGGESNPDAVTIRHLVIDHVMPRVLNLLGVEALHATAIAPAAGACAFIGDAGTGKSTLAASFQLAGVPVFCDDCLVVRDQGGIFATPAYPGVRLWQDSLQALGGSEPRLPVAQYTSKTRLLGDAATFCALPLPLARIYLVQRIGPDDQVPALPALEPISPAHALPELIGASFPLDLGDSAMLARHFRLITRVAATVPLRRLLIPTDFAALAAVRAAVLADLEAV